MQCLKNLRFKKKINNNIAFNKILIIFQFPHREKSLLIFENVEPNKRFSLKNQQKENFFHMKFSSICGLSILAFSN